MGEFLQDIFHNNIHQGCYLLASLLLRIGHKEPEPSLWEGPEEEEEEKEEEEEAEEEAQDEEQRGAFAGVHSAT